MHTRPRLLCCIGTLFLLIGLIAVGGCKKQASQSLPPVPEVETQPAANLPAPTPGTVEGAHPGKGIYDANGCSRCHMLDGKGGTEGPDLSKIGANPEHTVEWLMEQIKNPKVHNPDSKMPAFETE
ncbi:MAG: c-type cytochrome, partial [Armatimonadota bacterium]|nr:c-type cytochrome [Armatimonadota bacterium]